MKPFLHPAAFAMILRILHGKSKPFIICSCLTIFFSSYASAQALPITDSSIAAQSINYTIQMYQERFGKTLLLYNGAEYIRPSPVNKGHPYLDSDELQPGAIYFDGIFYPHVLLAYDLVNGDVVVKGYHNINIRLVPQKVGYFYLSNRLFIPVATDSITKTFQNGFYEVLYMDDVFVLAHHIKLSARSFTAEEPNVFTAYTTYYIRKDNVLYKIESERNLLAALADEQEKVRKYMRQNKLNLKKLSAPAILQTVQYYTQLKR